MGLPVLTAVLGIGAGLSLIALLGHVFPAPSFSPIVASMIGLGVGVDYALFILTRFREALPPWRGAGDRDSDRHEHRGPHRGHRGHDRDHRDARAAGPAPVAAQRGGHRRRGHRGHGPARLAHPAPRPCSASRAPGWASPPGSACPGGWAAVPPWAPLPRASRQDGAHPGPPGRSPARRGAPQACPSESATLGGFRGVVPPGQHGPRPSGGRR